jgi:hypothetical protein
MHPFGKTRPVFVGLAAGLFTMIACFVGATFVGEITHSGILGICGPYGNYADLVGLLYLASVPIGVIAGCAVPYIVKRRLGNDSDCKSGNGVGREDKADQ